MPFKRHILPSGPLNLVSSITWGMNYPDVKAKFFSGDGTLNKNTATALHTDLVSLVDFMRNGGKVPPVKVQKGRHGEFILKDGRHRFVAHKLLGREKIEAKYYAE